MDPDAFNAFEARGWEDKAASYDHFVGDITGRFVEPLLNAVSAGPGTRLLDLATGPGYVAARAAEHGASVIGVDVAGAMIALADRLHPGLDFRQAAYKSFRSWPCRDSIQERLDEPARNVADEAVIAGRLVSPTSCLEGIEGIGIDSGLTHSHTVRPPQHPCPLRADGLG